MSMGRMGALMDTRPAAPSFLTLCTHLIFLSCLWATGHGTINTTEPAITTTIYNVNFTCPSTCTCTVDNGNNTSHLRINGATATLPSVKLELEHVLNTTEVLTIENAVLDKSHMNLPAIPLTALHLNNVTLESFAFFYNYFQHDPGIIRHSLILINISEAKIDTNYYLVQERPPEPVELLANLRVLSRLIFRDSNSDLVEVLLQNLPSSVSHISVNNCSFPQLESVSFAHLNNLTYLNMSKNYIGSVPGGFMEPLRYLRTLDLSYNQLEHLQEQVFVGLSSLETLDVSHNRIRYIDTDVFNPLTVVSSIDLSHNRLLQFFEPYFINNAHLATLLMSRTWVPAMFLDPATGPRSRMEMDRLLNTLQSVETLDLSHNAMTFIPETLTHAPKLTHVRLQGNPWQCTCSDRWFLDWITTARLTLTTSDQVLCHFSNEPSLPLLPYLNNITDSCPYTQVISRTPSRYYAVMGHSTLLQCHGQGNPWPTITWITPSKVHISADSRSHVDPTHSSFDTITEQLFLDNGDLFIENVSRTDYGLYLCIASYKDVNITHYVHLGVDVSMFADVRLMSIFVGWITSLSFLLVVLITQFIREMLNRCGITCISMDTTSQTRRVRCFFESLEQHKNSQLDWLKDNYNMQASKIKENCNQQMERIRDSYTTQTKNLSDIRDYGTQQLHTLRDQYYDQIRRVSNYSAQQLCRVRENYLFQRNRVCKFSSHQLLRLRETYKWQAQTLNKILENLPRTLNFDTCRGMGACARTDSIYMDDLSEVGAIEEFPQPKEMSQEMKARMEHISLLIPPEFLNVYFDGELPGPFIPPAPPDSTPSGDDDDTNNNENNENTESTSA